MMNLAEVNGLSGEAFAALFADVAEHSPWVAEKAARVRPFSSREAMIVAFEQALQTAARDMQLSLIRAHPDLAGRAKLTTDSRNEQNGAGLDSLSAAEFSKFNTLNEAYKARFGFPFIFAVKGATKQQILEGFEGRLQNASAVEFSTALAQIKRIFRFRIEEKVSL